MSKDNVITYQVVSTREQEPARPGCSGTMTSFQVKLGGVVRYGYVESRLNDPDAQLVGLPKVKLLWDTFKEPKEGIRVISIRGITYEVLRDKEKDTSNKTDTSN